LRGPVTFHQRKIDEYFELVHLIPQSPAEESTVGETVTVSVTAENDTGITSETAAVLTVDGTEADTASIEVEPYTTETIELETTFEETGKFTLSVNETAIGEIAVSEERTKTVPADSPTDQTASSAQSNAETKKTSTKAGGLGFSIIQSVVALSGIGYLLKWKLANSD
jgi:hypothetical protein